MQKRYLRDNTVKVPTRKYRKGTYRVIQKKYLRGIFKMYLWGNSEKVPTVKVPKW